MTELPDHMNFKIEGSSLVTGGYSYDLIEPKGIIRRHYYEPNPYAEGDVEGIEVFMVCGNRFCSYHYRDKWDEGVEIIEEILLEGLQPIDAADLPFDLEQSRKDQEEHLERTFWEPEREKARHDKEALAEFEALLPCKREPVEVAWRYQDAEKHEVVVCFSDGTPLWKGTHSLYGQSLFRSFENALKNRYGALLLSFRAELGSPYEGMTFYLD